MAAIFNKITAFFLAILTFLGLYTPAKTGVKTFRYGKTSSQKVDIFYPSGVSEGDDLCLFLYVHGGAWTGGDKSEGKGYCAAVAKEGVLAASMNYTLITEKNKVNAFDMLDEITICIGYMMKFAEKNGYTLSKIALMGYSAGAHLTSLYAYSRADECPLPISFIIEKSGPFDFRDEYWKDSTARDQMTQIIGMLSGEAVTAENREELIRRISPISYVTKDSVPTIMAYGMKDELVLYANSTNLASALQNAGVKYEAVAFPNSGHDVSSDAAELQKLNNFLIEYLNTYFGTDIAYI